MRNEMIRLAVQDSRYKVAKVRFCGCVRGGFMTARQMSKENWPGAIVIASRSKLRGYYRDGALLKVKNA